MSLIYGLGRAEESSIDQRLIDAKSLSGRLSIVHKVFLVGVYTLQMWKT